MNDKGYDYPDIRELVKDYDYTAHIRSRGEENIKIPGFRARRWVVERTHSWLNRFRRLLIRWEKKIENYLAMLHFGSFTDIELVFSGEMSKAPLDCILCYRDTIALKTPKSREKNEGRRYFDYCGITTTEYKWTTTFRMHMDNI